MAELKRLGPEDAAALAALSAVTFKRAYAHLHAREDLEAYCAAHCTPSKARAMLESAAIVCKAAYRDGAAVGYVTVRNAPCPVESPGASAELKQLYILPEAFGAGLGRALLQDAVETVRGFGGASVWLAVVDANERAAAFYRKSGFAYVGVGPTFRVGRDSLASRIMARAI